MITLACWVISVAAMAAMAVLGVSAAVPVIPGGAGWPPYALSAAPPAGLVGALGVIAAVAGAVATWRLLTAAREGRGPDPRRLLLGGAAAAAVLTLLPPTGGDITNYLAYGQEVLSGVNPYTAGPQSPGVPQDALTAAVDAPWQTTPSVYGPVFTALATVVVRIAAGDGHVAATLLRLLFAGAFVLTGVVLHRFAGSESGRRRAAVVWSANPLLLLTLVAGAHVDVLVAACLVGSLVLVRRAPPVSGALVGLAATLKLTGLVALPGLLWATRARGRVWPAILLGAAAVVVPWYLRSPGVFTQLHSAARFATPAAPWRAVRWLLDPVLGDAATRSAVNVLSAAAAVALIALLLRRGLPPAAGTEVGRAAAVTAAAALGWLLTASYVLPWYDALAWAPLALVAASWLDRVLLVHTTVLAVAFLPGRDVPLAGAVDLVHGVVHSGLSPIVLAVLVLGTVRLATRPVPAAVLGDWRR